MKRIIVATLVLFLGTKVSSQDDYQGRVGINTDQPKATLDVSRKDLGSLPAGQSQGVLFPQFTTDERDAFQNVEPGTMIYNTTEQCLEICISSSGGSCEWQCMEFNPLKATLLNVYAYIPSFSSITGSSIAPQQGKINSTDNKIKVKIPYQNGVGNYDEITIYVESSVGQDGKKKSLILKIPEGEFDTSGSGILEGEIEVEDGGEYLVKQLSLGQEESIADFVIKTNSGDATVSLKATGGILDRCYNRTTMDCWSNSNLADELEHEFVYMPIQGPDGKIWLNNNLGAEYSKVSSSNFNPLKQAESPTDPLAYGSLFQWQRPSDGHELIDWTNSTSGTPKYNTPSSNLSTNSGWIANDNQFITDTNDTNSKTWVNIGINNDPNNKNLWQTGGKNNPCPQGFHVPTKSELEALHNALTSNGKKAWDHPTFRLPAAGDRNNTNADLFMSGRRGNYWSSKQRSNNKSSYRLSINNNNSGVRPFLDRARGRSVRCIKD